MARGQLKRIQPDLVEEIEAYDGGSFSEKMMKWKIAEIEEALKNRDSNRGLTVNDVEKAIRNAQM